MNRKNDNIRYIKYTLTFFGVGIVMSLFTFCMAQQRAKIAHTPVVDLTLVGKITPTEKLFHRVDTNVFDDIPDAVKKRVVQSGGLAVAFKTNSPAIYAKWCTANTIASATMTAVAYRGLDLYIKRNGRWQYAGIARPRDGQECATTTIVRGMDNAEKECLLYLPLYDETTRLEVGVDEGSTMEAGAYPFQKRVLIYGSSIAQGASASRSGLAYPARLARETGVDFLNLGMGGSAKMEKPVVDMIASFDVDAFVLDCVPNSSPTIVSQRAAYMVETIRKKHPNAPIIVMQSVIRERGYFNLASGERVKHQNENIKKEVDKLLQKGVTNLHFISADDFLGHDHEGTVDGTHPNDLGFDRMIQVIKPKLTEILGVALN
ncbi:SGNH/GDSL hydrolase family protein [Sphingobacterium hotanense]|uniref:SGNH/GDSL hydrolase family protein n=1 Tax=Sphingobacterium hotanense TaxID=649196 RepID=UPI0021A5BA34|nr:SGNH/GDSL hydrolase family protein [Sphingobacterium hotanense]MCT1524508.1 SGNH/GDSL hydrolase family protein [Sphingobacterium hotanense]